MSFGFSVGDFVTIAQVSKLAWDTFTAIKNAPREWRALESEVQSLAISLKSLDDADTTLSVVQYTKGNLQRQQNLKDLLTNSNNALAPMKELIDRYRVKDIDEKRDIRDWLAGAKFTFQAMSVQEFRNKLSLHTASLNIFLTTLTNTSLGRLEQLILSSQATAHTGPKLAASTGNANHDHDDGFGGIWSAIGRDLALGTGDKKTMTNEIFGLREEIRDYVQFLTSGGLPYSKHELSDRRRIRPQRVTYKLGIGSSSKPADAVPYTQQVPIEDLTTTDEDDELKTLFDAMVSFDGDSAGLDTAQNDEDDDPFDNPPSASRSPPSTPIAQAHMANSKPAMDSLQRKTS